MEYLYPFIAGLALYLLWKLVKTFHFYFREYYMLWNIAMGGQSGRRSVDPKIRLHVYVCQTDLLDEVSVNELYRFLTKMMDSEVTITQFCSVLLSYKYAILCRERKDGSLRGVMLFGVDRREINGSKYTLLRLGLASFQNYYRGGPLFYYVAAYHVLKEKICHPFTPVYIIGKLFSYKSYMVLCRNMPHTYPRHNMETPEFVRNLINEYGKRAKMENEIYDPETFILKRETTTLKEGVVPLTKADLEEPNIKFFVERNPGWEKGHQMITAGEMRWSDLVVMVWKNMAKVARGRGGAKVRRKRYGRRFSFQNELANHYATTYSEIDVGGENKHHAEQ